MIQKQRELNKKLREGPEDPDDEDFVKRMQKENNELFYNVRYTREAVLDAENVELIVKTFSKKVDDMIQVCLCVRCSVVEIFVTNVRCCFLWHFLSRFLDTTSTNSSAGSGAD